MNLSVEQDTDIRTGNKPWSLNQMRRQEPYRCGTTVTLRNACFVVSVDEHVAGGVVIQCGTVLCPLSVNATLHAKHHTDAGKVT